MKKILVLLVGIIFLFGCDKEHSVNEQNHSEHKAETSGNDLIAVDYSVSSDGVKAGEPTDLTFVARDSSGNIFREMDIVHEKPIHLLIVSEDLKEFYHIHPEQQNDGSFKVSFAFPNGGYYRLYADLTPKGKSRIVKNFTQIVVGQERAKEKLAVDEKFEKTVDGLRVVMNSDAAFESGRELMLNFQVFDAASNQPVTDLENYLGELAHFVIISEDLRDFVHAHPMSRETVKASEQSHAEHSGHENVPKLSGKDSQSIVSAHVSFPNAAKYKIWAQFQRAGKVITVPFVIETKQGKAEKTLSEAVIPDGAYKIVVSKDGFAPQEIAYKKGQPLKLAFLRIDEENCGDEIVFKDLNIKKKLPVGQVVTVDVPTDKAGEINFACGMEMFKGKIIIQ